MLAAHCLCAGSLVEIPVQAILCARGFPIVATDLDPYGERLVFWCSMPLTCLFGGYRCDLRRCGTQAMCAAEAYTLVRRDYMGARYGARQ